MCGGQGFRATLVKKYIREFCRIRLAGEWMYSYQQKIVSWCNELADFYVPNEIQSVMIWPMV